MFAQPLTTAALAATLIDTELTANAIVVCMTCSCACLQEDVRSIDAGVIPMPKYANSQAAFYAVQQAPPPMPMPPPIPIETSATVRSFSVEKCAMASNYM